MRIRSHLFIPVRRFSENSTQISSSFYKSVNHLLLSLTSDRFKVTSSSKQNPLINQQVFNYLFKCQITTRLIDYAAYALISNNQSYYRINNMGHEGLAALAYHVKLTDPKLLHYRSGAAYVEWLTRANEDPITESLRSLVCSRQSFSGGRHKVYGSVSANIIPQTPTIASHLPKAVGLCFAIQKSKALNRDGKFPHDSMVFCSFGDGSFNHGSAQDALNMAEWLVHKNVPMPLLMVCENNGVSMSTENSPAYIETIMSRRPGFHYLKANGLNLLDTYDKSKTAITLAKKSQRPVFLDIKTTRLSTHYTTRLYEKEEQVDPLLYTAALAVHFGYLSSTEISNIIREVSEQIDQKIKLIIQEDRITNLEDNTLIVSNPRQIIYKQSSCKFVLKQEPLTLSKTINYSLTELMYAYPQSILFGDDVANKDGGAYGTTKDLEQLFGSERVFNTPITETSLLATAQMASLQGLIPIVELRHLAYIHNAIDQIRGEASTTAWLSNGKYNTPLLLRIPALGYNIFGGHFHNDSSTAALRDINNIIIACASNPKTAASLLQKCLRLVIDKQQIVIYIEPIALYHKKDLYDNGDNKFLSDYNKNLDISLSKVDVYGSSDLLTIITYGNGFYISLKVAHELKKENVYIQVIDLRWLKPLAMDSICEVIRSTPHVLIVDEGRKTASLSEELFTRLSEEANEDHVIHRITTPDTFLPLGPAILSFFPSQEKIISFIHNNVISEKNEHDDQPHLYF